MKIKENKNYQTIIKHQNYNPRIIDYITNPIKLTAIEPAEYFNFIIKNLKFPSKVWDDEFRNRLNDQDRIFMNTLYSLTDKNISLEIVRKAFDYRMFKSGKAETRNIFNDVLERLTNSLIKLQKTNTMNDVILEVSVVNPSVNDYLREELKQNVNEQKNIVALAKYINQIDKMMAINPNDAHTFFSHDLINLETFTFSKNLFYLEYITKFTICDLAFQNQVRTCFVGICNEVKGYTETVIIDLIDSPLFEFYNLTELFIENLNTTVVFFKFDSLISVFSWLVDTHGPLKRKTVKIFREAFINAVEREVYNQIIHLLPSIVREIINDVGEQPAPYNDETTDEYYYYYYDYVEKALIKTIEEEVDELVNEIPIPFSKKDIDFENIMNEVDIGDEIFAYFNEPNDDYDKTEYDEALLSEKEELEYIDAMFEIKQ